MKILGIETSCDETAISVLEYEAKKRRFRLLANFVYSQIAIHKPFGGVVPNLAKREHQKNLVPILELALQKTGLLKKKEGRIKDNKLKKIEEILIKEELLAKNSLNFLAKYQKPKIDLIAVTKGPGLAPALWPGVNFSRALSFYWQIPLVGINHLEGHIFANWLPKKEMVWEQIKIPKNLFPSLSLIVSGGHTQLVLIKKLGEYKIIGETRDDAAGECFDKTARLLNLGYPGGPAISKEAEKIKQGIHYSLKLPRPMINSKDYDFSFAGLKTAVLYLVEELKKRGVDLKKIRPIIAKEIQDSINEVLVTKTIRAAKNFKTRSIILGGGVTANENLKILLINETQKNLPKIPLLIPEKKYTGDNAAMIALVGWFRKKSARLDNWKKVEADANLKL